MATEANSPEDEVTKLQARIDELEAKLSSQQNEIKELEDKLSNREKQTETTLDDLSDSIRDTSNRMIEETRKLIKGSVLAESERLRLAAEIAQTFAEEISTKTEGEEEAVANLARLPVDIYSGLLKAIDQSLHIPRKVYDKFYESYKDKETNNPS